MSIDVMKQALEVLSLELPIGSHIELKNALRAAIEQAQEPVAWVGPSWLHPETRGWASDSFESIQIEGWIPLYTAPRQWQGLTDEEREQFRQWAHPDIIEAIELKLQERNT